MEEAANEPEEELPVENQSVWPHGRQYRGKGFLSAQLCWMLLTRPVSIGHRAGTDLGLMEVVGDSDKRIFSERYRSKGIKKMSLLRGFAVKEAKKEGIV